jgi:flagellin
MAVVINSNIASLDAQRNLAKTQMDLSRSMQRLSSGLRVNTGADDAAGLAISESLRAQVASLQQASRNANDGVSLLQTAEGSLNEVSGILVRMRELATESSNGTLTNAQRDSLHTEFGQLRDEIDRIGDSTKFNGVSLLDGSLSSSGVTFQVGLDNSSASQLTVKIDSAKSADLGGSSALSSATVSTASGAQSALATIDNAIDSVSKIRAGIGAATNRLSSTVANLATTVENLSAANSRIRDVDVAEETAAMTRSQILTQAGVSVLAQANQAPSVALSLLR